MDAGTCTRPDDVGLDAWRMSAIIMLEKKRIPTGWGEKTRAGLARMIQGVADESTLADKGPRIE